MSDSDTTVSHVHSVGLGQGLMPKTRLAYSITSPSQETSERTAYYVQNSAQTTTSIDSNIIAGLVRNLYS